MSTVDPPAASADASPPTFEDARALAEWEPPFGVISIALRLDPGDRGGAWRTELRNGLDRILEGGEELDHDVRVALKATVARIAERFDGRDQRSLPRGELGFVEVGKNAGAERWWSSHVFPEVPCGVYYSERPVVGPLVGIVARGAPRGVVLLSADRVRLFHWCPGSIEEVHDWELTLTSGDWRERKSQSSSDPARAQGVSASGREQFGDRLSENRHRFLRECHRLALEVASERGWPEIVAFGAAQHVGAFREGISSRPDVEIGGEVDLISNPAGELEAVVREAIERLDMERDRHRLAEAIDQAQAGMRGALGAKETLAALEEGRVEHLFLDAARQPLATASEAVGDGVGEIDSENLVRRALTSGAKVTAASGDVAALLAPVDGVAASLRY